MRNMGISGHSLRSNERFRSYERFHVAVRSDLSSSGSQWRLKDMIFPAEPMNMKVVETFDNYPLYFIHNFWKCGLGGAEVRSRLRSGVSF